MTEVVCKQDKYPGPCKGSMLRYFYNVATKTCEKLNYGGCGANHNNFRTLRACQATCDKPCKLRTCVQEYCKYGRETDENGCSTCKCNDPCEVSSIHYYYY